MPEERMISKENKPDDMKLQSSMTLFSLVPDADPVFKKVLYKFFEEKVDERTLEIMKHESE